MKDPNTHIDDFFKEGLEGYSETPPPAVWDALEKRLDGKKDRKGFGWFWPITILSFMALFGGTVAWRLNSNSPIAGTEIKAANNGKTAPMEEKATTNNIEQQVAGNINGKESANAESKTHEIIKEQKTRNLTTNKIPSIHTASQSIQHENPAQSSHANNEAVAVKEKPVAENKAPEQIAATNEVSKTVKPTEVPATEKAVPTVAATKPAGDNNESKPAPVSVAKKTIEKKPEMAKAEKTAIAKQTKAPAIEKIVSKPAAIAAAKTVEPAKDEVKEKIIPASKQDEGKENAQKAIAVAKTEAKTVSKRLVVATMPAKKAPVRKVIPADAAKTSIENSTADKAKHADEKKAVATEPVAKTSVAISPVAIKTVTPKPGKPEDKPVLKQVSANEANENEPVAKLNNEPAEKGPKQPAEPVYNSATNTAAKEVVAEKKVVTEMPKPAEQKVISTFKEDKPLAMNSGGGAFTNAAVSSPSVSGIDTSSPRGHENRWQMGVKGGFETGVSKNASNKIVVSPFAEYSLTKKFSLLFQPSLNISKAYNRVLNGNQSFYSKNQNSTTLKADSSWTTIAGPGGGIVDSGWEIRYTYTQTHDSVAKSYATGGSYIELGLPILLKFQLMKKLSIYGGVNISYSKYIPIKENTFNSSAILLSGSTPNQFVSNGHYATPPPVDSAIHYTGKPISAYSGPLYSSQNGDLWRLGYMLGFSYEFKQRWLFDVLVQQSSAPSNVLGGIDINSPLTLPYFRITLGYKLGSIPIKFLK